MSQCELLSSWLHRPCHEPTSGQTLHRVTNSYGCIHGLNWGPSWVAEAQQPHHSLHHGLQGNPCSGCWSKSTLFFADLGPTGLFLSQILIPVFQLLFRAAVSLLPKHFVPEVLQPCSLSQCWPVLAQCWHWLTLALADKEGPILQITLLELPHYQKLAMQSQDMHASSVFSIL